jgi:uncharacterized protein YvpB
MTVAIHKRSFLPWATALAAAGLAVCSPPASMPMAGGLDGSTVAFKWSVPQASAQPLPAPRPKARVLAIRIDYQDHRLSCEAAALKMALAYEGIRVDELTLMRYMSNDRHTATFDNHGRLIAWGDPARSYVGNPDGHIEGYTGYGVYNAPVARAAIRAGASVLRSGSGLYGTRVPPNVVYDAVLDGHPVVVWISNTYHHVGLDYYRAYDGAIVRYTLTEHAVTLVGVRPGAVLINDPWFGRAWHAKAQFESAYSTFDDMAVVIGGRG